MNSETQATETLATSMHASAETPAPPSATKKRKARAASKITRATPSKTPTGTVPPFRDYRGGPSVAAVDLTETDVVFKPLTITVRTALRLTGIGLTTLYKLIGEGEIETRHVGTRRLILYKSLEKFLDVNQPAPRGV